MCQAVEISDQMGGRKVTGIQEDKSSGKVQNLLKEKEPKLGRHLNSPGETHMESERQKNEKCLEGDIILQ